MCRVFLSVFLFFAMGFSYATGLRTCALNYEFETHEGQEVDYAEARRRCINSGWSLAEIRTSTMSAALLRILKNKQYYIGLKRSYKLLRNCEDVIMRSSILPIECQKGMDGEYYWSDGERGNYQSWGSGEGYGEKCVVLDGGVGGKWRDKACNHRAFFVCQRSLRASVSIGRKSLVVDDDTSEVNCSTPFPSTCVTKMTWLDSNGNEMSNSRSSNVYQEKSYTSTQSVSKLVLTNANIAHEGSYVCKIQIGSQQASEQTEISISASPTINKIILSKCSSQMNVSWTSNIKARGYPHDLKVFPTTNKPDNKQKKLDASETFEATVGDLKPNTQYTIEISVCKTGKCSHGTPARQTITTEGKPQSVSSATMSLLGSKCSIRWEPPSVVSNKITGYKVEVIKALVKSRNPTSNVSQTYEESKAMYTIYPEPNMKYFARIKAVTCAGAGQAVTVKGFCIRLPQAPTSVEKPIITQFTNATYVEVTIPEETKGLISCLLVVISDQIDSHDTLNVTNLITGPVKNRYLAIAIPPSRFVGKRSIQLKLGDNTTSSCVVNDASTIPVDNGRVVLAQNKPLSQDQRYRVFVVAVVPRTKNYAMRSGPGAIIEPMTPEKEKGSETATTFKGRVSTVPNGLSPNFTNAVLTNERLLIDARYLALIASIIPLLLIAWIVHRCKRQKAQIPSDDAQKKDNPIYDDVPDPECNKLENDLPQQGDIHLYHHIEPAYEIPVATSPYEDYQF